MQVLVIINRLEELKPRQTTAMLIAELSRRDADVFVAELETIDIVLQDSDYSVRCSAMATRVTSPMESSEDVVGLETQPTQRIELSHADRVVLRTNPGRDPDRRTEHEQLLFALTAVDSIGIRVTNSPSQLARLAAKSSLFALSPEHRPRGMVSTSPDVLLSFIAGLHGECVVKPVVGSRGQNVFKLSASITDDDQATVRDLVKLGPVICQEFVPWDQPGDIRFVVFDGEPLEIDGAFAAIHRVPAAGDFRGNLHAGGTAQAIEPTPEMLAATRHAAQYLKSHGVTLAGIDLVGSKIIEMNVFSTGGLFDSHRLYDRDFVSKIVDGWQG